MLKKLSLAKIEMVLASVLAFGIISLSADLPYTVPCTFFFGEPKYPADK